MNHKPYRSPPLNFSKFLNWFCKKEYIEDIQGDLIEEYHLLLDENISVNKANNWYRKQVIRLFRPSMMKETKVQQLIEKQTTMFKNHLKIGYRNLWKYKNATVINISGLALGMAAFILISLFIQDELNYDKHHENADNIYRVTVKNFTFDGSMSRHWAFASAGHASRLKEDYSFITHAVRFFVWAYPDLQHGDLKLPSQQVVFCDNDVFDIFSFPFLIGNKEQAFQDIYSIVLTEETAIRVFGNDWKEKDILGTPVILSRDGNEGPFKVSGVIENMPEQQHFHFDYLAPIRFVESIMGEGEMNNVGGNYNWLTYLRIDPNTNMDEFHGLSDGFFDKYMDKTQNQLASERYKFAFQPLKDIHLHSNLESEIETNGSIQQIYIFGIVGVLLLIVACINYMNLATSHYSRRMKEVGVRKVVGASRSSLLAQFLTESLLITLLSTPVTVVLVIFGLPYINTFMDKNLIFDVIQNIELICALLLLTLLVSAAAGMYPALFLSRINALKSLKGESTMKSSKWNFRSWLVTFQFAVAIALIFSILVIESQMQFIQNSDPGYQKEHILNLNLSRNINNVDVFKRELLSIPDVENVTMSSRIPTGRLMDNMGSKFYKGDSLVPSNFRLPQISVDEYFLNTYDIELIAGEPFKKSQDMYIDSIGYYIINRKAAEAMGYQNPKDIIGAKLSYGPFNGNGLKIGNIQGVVEDFHFESMHSPIVPMVMLKTNDNFREVSLKLKSHEITKTLESIESVYAKFDPETSPSYHFIDELFDLQYQNEERLGKMIKVFTFIAIFIGCLGLIGMVGFIIETKTKEIGIRKVLGASVQNIIQIISSHFFVLIMIAFTVAIPISFWYMSDWLEAFEYRTEISLTIIFLPLVFTFIFTAFTLGYQSFKASNANPVESLKAE
ncbi:MAG: FtsX-like permease family protein [Reichenbachiella sp.]